MLFTICSITCGTLHASALYELDIDPWGDLEDVKNPGITDTPMAPEVEDPADQEDPEQGRGGVSTWSLNDDDSSRTLVLKGNIQVGYSSSNYSTVTSGTWSLKDTSSLNTKDIGVHQNGSTSYKTTYLRVSSGTYFDYTAPVSYAKGEYARIEFTGVGQFYLRTNNPFGNTTYPQEVVLLVNGQEYGEIYDASEGFQMYSIALPTDTDITSLGYRFRWNTTFTNTLNGSSGASIKGLQAMITDTGSFILEVAKEEPEYNGLLGTIIGWLQNLYNGIIAIPKSIIDGLLDGLSGLFVPSEEDVTVMKDKYDTLLQDRLGFIYEGFSLTASSYETIKTGMENVESYSFTFPGISFPYKGEIVVLVPEMPVSLENDLMDVLRPVLGTAVSCIAVAAWLSRAFDMVVALISGVSYFSYLKSNKEEVEA